MITMDKKRTQSHVAALLCYKAIKLPSYLTCLLSPYRQSRVLSDLLSTQSSHSLRFSCCAHTVWNILPSFVRTADSFTSFRS